MRPLPFLAALAAAAALTVAVPLAAEARPPIAPPGGSPFVLWHDEALASTARPTLVEAASDGRVWYLDDSTLTVFAYDPSTRTSTEYPATTGAFVSSMVEAADGAIWYNDLLLAGGLHRLDPATGLVADFPLPLAVRAMTLAAAPDGSVWFGTTGTDTVGTVTPASGVSLVDTHGSGGAPQDIAWGSDGRLWMTQFGRPAIDAFDPVSGLTRGYSIPSSTVTEIAAGGDGALWLTDGSALTRVATDGRADVLPVPTATGGPAFPFELERAGVGVVFTDTAGRILTAAADGSITPIGPRGADRRPQSLTVGPDGALWFADRTPLLSWA